MTATEQRRLGLGLLVVILYDIAAGELSELHVAVDPTRIPGAPQQLHDTPALAFWNPQSFFDLRVHSDGGFVAGFSFAGRTQTLTVQAEAVTGFRDGRFAVMLPAAADGVSWRQGLRAISGGVA